MAKYNIAGLVIYCGLTMSQGVYWLSFVPNIDIIAALLSVSKIHIYILAMLLLMGYPLLYQFSRYAHDHKGLHIGLKIAPIFRLVGGSLRIFGYYHYIYLLIGQILIALADPFICMSVSKIA